MVYKATLKRRAGIEVFDTIKTLKPEEPCQVVAVKKLQGNCNHYAKGKSLHNLGRSSLFKIHLKEIMICKYLPLFRSIVLDLLP